MTHYSITALVRVHFLVERQHGSSEKEIGSQRKQGGPQRFSAQGCAYPRQKESGPQRFGAQGCSQAPLAPFETSKTKKPATSPAFLHCGYAQTLKGAP
jgi:hypothetical protein